MHPYIKVVCVVPGIGDGKLDRRWMFKITASNGRVLCRSDLYKSKAACMTAVSIVHAAQKTIKVQP